VKRSRGETTQTDLRDARVRLLQMHFESGVGHIGGNLSALDSLVVAFREYLEESDIFVLSKGHAAGALYTALWSVGRLDDTDLRTFHGEDTLLAGHPPTSGIADIHFATGSLGHGLSLGAGTALGFKLHGKSARVLCLTSDGEWQEGATWEAIIFALHHNLENLTVLVDENGLQGFGSTAEVASMTGLDKRLRGFGADVVVIDGHDLAALREALGRTSKGPNVVVMQTIKGRGVSFMENRMEWHYLPLNEESFEKAMGELNAL
jgi:transketolase